MDPKHDWLGEAAERAETYLRRLPPETLGPAARALLGLDQKPCVRCNGTGVEKLKGVK